MTIDYFIDDDVLKRPDSICVKVNCRYCVTHGAYQPAMNLWFNQSHSQRKIRKFKRSLEHQCPYRLRSA